MLDNNNYYTLFNMPEVFILDYAELNKQLHLLQRVHHPDSKDRNIQQLSALINKAYQTLLCPIKRAEHLLAIHLVNSDEKVTVSHEFLIWQLEIQEELETANYIQCNIIAKQINALLDNLYIKIDELLKIKNYCELVICVHQLKFYNKILSKAKSIAL